MYPTEAEEFNRKNCYAVANGTTDREAHPKRWIAVLVQINTEKTTSFKLNKLGIENFVPTQTEVHQWSDRKKKIERVVIPMIVFVRTDKENELKIKSLSTVYKFISYPGNKEAATIPSQQIDDLRFMLKNSPSQVNLQKNDLMVGDSVEIVRGPLKGLSGTLNSIDNCKHQICLYLKLLGYVCVSIDINDVVKINE